MRAARLGSGKCAPQGAAPALTLGSPVRAALSLWDTLPSANRDERVVCPQLARRPHRVPSSLSCPARVPHPFPHPSPAPSPLPFPSPAVARVAGTFCPPPLRAVSPLLRFFVFRFLPLGCTEAFPGPAPGRVRAGREGGRGLHPPAWTEFRSARVRDAGPGACGDQAPLGVLGLA